MLTNEATLSYESYRIRTSGCTKRAPLGSSWSRVSFWLMRRWQHSTSTPACKLLKLFMINSDLNLLKRMAGVQNSCKIIAFTQVHTHPSFEMQDIFPISSLVEFWMTTQTSGFTPISTFKHSSLPLETIKTQCCYKQLSIFTYFCVIVSPLMTQPSYKHYIVQNNKNCHQYYEWIINSTNIYE